MSIYLGRLEREVISPLTMSAMVFSSFTHSSAITHVFNCRERKAKSKRSSILPKKLLITVWLSYSLNILYTCINCNMFTQVMDSHCKTDLPARQWDVRTVLCVRTKTVSSRWLGLDWISQQEKYLPQFIRYFSASIDRCARLTNKKMSWSCKVQGTSCIEHESTIDELTIKNWNVCINVIGWWPSWFWSHIFNSTNQATD